MKRIVGLLLACMLVICAASAETAVFAANDRGINFVERMGLGFPISDEMALRNGDILQTNVGSGLTVHADDMFLALNERAELEIEDAAPESLAATLRSGELFVCAPAGKSVRLTVAGHTMDLSNAAAYCTARTGSASVSMLRGSAADCAEGMTVSFIADQIASGAFAIASLNEFALSQTKTVPKTMPLCVSEAEIDALIADRAAERQRAWDELQAGAEGDSDRMYCTIEIRCDTILDHMDMLEPGKDSYVPSDGTILTQVRVAFDAGETAYDVLRRACEYADIQMEASWTPIYNSYYVEGIHQLYEFDCGSESGWMYKVNGWFPNYGCSEYHLQDGDSIVWCYTCVGIGADVGGDVY